MRGTIGGYYHDKEVRLMASKREIKNRHRRQRLADRAANPSKYESLGLGWLTVKLVFWVLFALFFAWCLIFNL